MDREGNRSPNTECLADQSQLRRAWMHPLLLERGVIKTPRGDPASEFRAEVPHIKLSVA